MLTQGQLAHTLFPLGGYTKEHIRAMARERNISVADKPDSQEICFVPDNDYGSFIRARAGKRSGRAILSICRARYWAGTEGFLITP